MAELPNPYDNESFNRLFNGRTRAERNVFGYPQQLPKYVRADYLNKPNQTSRAFNYEPEIDALAEKYGFDFPGVMDVTSKEALAEAQDIWMSEEVWEGFERSPGVKKQAKGFNYANYADNPITPDVGAINVQTGKSVPTGPVSFNDDRVDDVEIPTATENPERPRTVAAAFDNQRSIITLVFRDGTLYNYYNCSQKMWDDFKALPSKFEYIADTLDKQPRGIANMAGIPEELRIIAYGRARAEQVRRAKAGGWKPRTRARYTDIQKAKANGKNPADYKMKRVRSKSTRRGPL